MEKEFLQTDQMIPVIPVENELDLEGAPEGSINMRIPLERAGKGCVEKGSDYET